ncbi:MAG: exodeoxyribonuclease VII large subunit [bacterium]|nr:exodeoxyribonuclease VII large subunit [bacterium]
MIKKNDDNTFYGDLFENFSDHLNTPKPDPISKIKKNKDRKIFRVKDLNKIVKTQLESDFSGIWVEGEISNAKLHSSGHFYFSLKDKEAQIRAVMFKGMYSYLKFTPENGIKVLLKGSLTCFIKTGSYQINAKYMETKGLGSLQLAYEQLKNKLQSEGLFDPTYKKNIPMLPQKIGVITSPTGAAIRDILSVINRRYANVNIIIYPVRVQGDEAKFEIRNAIKYFNKKLADTDVLLIGRGGGSIEDLWPFNEEVVARAISDSIIPTISCVGHEVDFVISDFVADLRAATPSSSAELVIRDKLEIKKQLDYSKSILKKIMANFIQNYAQDIDYLNERFQLLVKNTFDKKAYKLGLLHSRLINLSPHAITSRGYAIVKDLNNQVRPLESFKVNDQINIKGYNTELFCEILKMKTLEKKSKDK